MVFCARSLSLPFPCRFLWAFVVLGTYMSFAACVGLIGADFLNKCRCGVGFHLYLVAFALIIQFVFVILLFSDPGLIIKTPDVTGAEAKVWGVVHAHVPLARGVVIAALVVQVIDAGLAFALARSAIPAEAAESDDEYFDKHYGRRARGRSAGSSRGMGNQSDDDSDDRQISSNSTRGSSQRGRGFFGKRGGLTVPLLDSEDEEVSTSIEDGDTSNGSETETWAERMRSKYNLDTSRLKYDPERGEGGEGGDGDENRASCGIQ